MRRVFLLGVAVFLLSASAGVPQPAQSISKAEFETWKKKYSNWGRWGADDQLGAVNLITPAKRRQAAALVKEGVSVSLSRDTDLDKAVDNPDPYEHRMLTIGTDRFAVAPHGVAHTHLDSLAHINENGVFFNRNVATLSCCTIAM